MMRIKLIRAILSPRPSDFLRTSIIHFHMFLYVVTCFLWVTVSFLCLSQAWKDAVPIYPYQIIVKWDEIVRAFNRHSNETVTLGKHVTKYKNMRKWMVQFLRKSESRDDKIARVNSFASPNPSIYLNFIRCWSPLWCWHF